MIWLTTAPAYSADSGSWLTNSPHPAMPIGGARPTYRGVAERCGRVLQVGVFGVQTLPEHCTRPPPGHAPLAEHPDPAEALCILVRVMIDTGTTKITLASLAGERGELPGNARTASDRLRTAVELVLHRAQDCGVAHRAVTVDELYLLARGLSQASPTLPATASMLQHPAVDIVLAGIGADGHRT